MNYKDDARCYNIQYQYIFVEDILVAPVHKESQEEWMVYLPEDNWVHIFTGEKYSGGDVMIKALLGCLPIFFVSNLNINIFSKRLKELTKKL